MQICNINYFILYIKNALNAHHEVYVGYVMPVWKVLSISELYFPFGGNQKGEHPQSI